MYTERVENRQTVFLVHLFFTVPLPRLPPTPNPGAWQAQPC